MPFLLKSLRVLGWSIAWLIIVLGLALTIVPPMLDRIYYDGPVSGHYDGERFFNPGGDDTFRMPAGRSRGSFLLRWLTGSDDRPAWPDRVAVTPGYGDPQLVACPPQEATPQEPWARCNAGALDPQAMSVTWVGHATALVQTAGFAMLTDPIWSNVAGRWGIGPRRVAAPGIRIDDLPKIDLIVISHNHYDHLDIATLKRLWERDRPLIVTGLGNDTILAKAGIPSRGLDWGGVAVHPKGVRVRVERNHHWGSRWGTDRNRALWSAFTIDTGAGRVYFAGDTGFGDGRWPGEAVADGAPVRLAILPIGAFRFAPGMMNTGSHVGPQDAIRIWDRLGRPPTLPIHWGTFRLSNEAYWTPPRMLAELQRCVGSPGEAFAAKTIGAAWAVPPVGARGAPVDEARLAACTQSAAVRAFQ